ncbi:MAG: flap endonuclease-1 [Fervidicoccus fontis]|nr:MAG: flap endonuclease-1 [Fervidicoccus fontis]
MGVNIRDLIPPEAIKEIELESLKGRTIAIDAYNALYQFLAAIRQPDGTPLIDNKGKVTSHLSGIFYRTINLIEAGIKPIYVFDGLPPSLKEKELEKRRKVKEEAAKKYQVAIAEEKYEEARKYAQMSTRLNDEMVKEAIKLLDAMGLPTVQAPAEGEAQAAYMAKKGDVWSSGSQDYDSILFGSPRVVRNLTVSGKRKLPKKDVYIDIKPEVIESNVIYEKLGINREKLIIIGIMLGTDYNPDGIKGVGIKTALKIVKSYEKTEEILKSLPQTQVDYYEIFNYFMNPEVTDNYTIQWKEPSVEKIKEILVEEHDFNEARVENAIERLQKSFKENVKSQTKGLDFWFK